MVVFDHDANLDERYAHDAKTEDDRHRRGHACHLLFDGVFINILKEYRVGFLIVEAEQDIGLTENVELGDDRR